MNVHQAFPSQYLKASDLGLAEPVVTIARVELEAIGRDKEHKPVVYFEGKGKGVVLNKTNAKRIADLLGSPDTDDWTGQRIRLYATTTEFSGEQVECIRIKSAVPVPRPTAPRPAPVVPAEPSFTGADDDVPF